MATKKVSDTFANMATIYCLESAANTLTYKKLETSFGTFEKIAWVVHRIEYLLDTVSTAWNGTDDCLHCALMTGNVRATIAGSAVFTDPQVVDIMRWQRIDFGTAAAGSLYAPIATKDFAGLPSGGLIVPPAPLYGAIQGVGMASAGAVVMRIYYTIKELATEEYWELVEARRLLTA